MRQRVGVILGGQSAEHQVSLQSARNIIAAIDKTLFEVVVLAVTRQGKWWLLPTEHFLKNSQDPRNISLPESGTELVLIAGDPHHQFQHRDSQTPLPAIDVIFPIIHGSLGEDGSLQGLLRILDLAWVGPGVLSSAMAMDKEVTKRLLRDSGLNIAPFISITRANQHQFTAEQIIAVLGLPLFVKPANQGSSVGVHKVWNADGLIPAIQDSLRYDRKILIESAIIGREIECAVLGNDWPEASVCGEIVLVDEYYSYDTKYINDQGAKVVVPAEISADNQQKIRQIALQVYRSLECCGMARVDVFLTPDDQVIVNEINTLPGFTDISMYPKLWEASGLNYQDLITRLIELAIERHQQDKQIASNVLTLH